MTRILTADDRSENNYLMRALLEGSGYRVDVASDGAQALAIARRTPPDLIISDILMPVMDGFQLCRECKADVQLREIPFIFYTATYTDPKDRAFALDLGADAFAVKPLESDALLRLVRTHLGRRAAALALPVADDEAVVLRQYNAVLIHKLEQKVDQLETAELRAQRSQERLALALEGAEAGIWDWDLASGRIIWNDQHATLFGLRAEQFDGSYDAFRRCVHPDDVAAIEEKVAAARALHRDYLHEFRVVWPDGSVHWIAGRGRFFYDADGAAQRMNGVVFDITERKQVEESLRESRAHLEALARRLLDVQESERRAIARELHDEIGGVLTAVKLNLHSLRGQGAGGAGDAALADSLELVDGAIQSVRSLSLDLRPSMLDDLGLIPTLKWYCQRQAGRSGVAIDLALEAIDLKAAPHLESACFRIVQEGVTNALRHSGAGRIRVALRRDDGRFAIEIVDDGRGYDVALARQRGVQGESSGLLGIEERARLLGGRLAIASSPGAGARIRVEFALPDDGSA